MPGGAAAAAGTAPSRPSMVRLARMSELARTEEREGEQREWMMRTLAVLQAPKPVFQALRDDSPAAAAARAEPVLALVIMAGIGALLLLPDASTALDQSEYDGTVLAVWLFIVGGILGGAAYWMLGGILYGASTWLGSLGSYRRARHVLAFAAAPLALSAFVLLPLRLAFFGSDTFHAGGSDAGTLGTVIAVLGWGFVVWAAALLLVGVRAVHAWTWQRAAGTVALTVAAVALVALVRLALTA